MTARSTFNASTAAAEATKTASKSAAMVAYTNSVASGTSVQVAPGYAQRGTTER